LSMSPYHENVELLSSVTVSAERDTIVVSAQKEAFQKIFIAENRWYKVAIHTGMIHRIKYIAVYQTAPVSAITHIAPVKSIELWPDSRKYVLNFGEPATAIGPIRFIPKPKGITNAPQAPRYTNHEHLMKARNLDEAF
jgi:hypothetical protein